MEENQSHFSPSFLVVDETEVGPLRENINMLENHVSIDGYSGPRHDDNRVPIIVGKIDMGEGKYVVGVKLKFGGPLYLDVHVKGANGKVIEDLIVHDREDILWIELGAVNYHIDKRDSGVR